MLLAVKVGRWYQVEMALNKIVDLLDWLPRFRWHKETDGSDSETLQPMPLFRPQLTETPWIPAPPAQTAIVRWQRLL